MSTESKGNNYFGVMIGLFVLWFIIFVGTLITKAPALARGVLPAISAAVVLWLGYWTIVAIRGRFTKNEQSSTQDTQCQQENAVASKGRVSKKK